MLRSHTTRMSAAIRSAAVDGAATIVHVNDEDHARTLPQPFVKHFMLV